MKNIYILLFGLCVIYIVSSCSTTGSATKCPNMASRHIQRPIMAYKYYSLPKKAKVVAQKATEAAPRSAKQSQLLAFLRQEIPVSTRIPSYLAKEIEAGNFEKVNKVLTQYSNNKVFLTRNSEGKMMVKATEFKALTKMTQQIIFKKPAQRMSDDARDILALVGGILGIVSAGTSPIPFFNFFSIFLGAGGIVLGILGLQSFNRRKWALLGIILGAIGITLSILFIVIYFVILGLWWV